MQIMVTVPTGKRGTMMTEKRLTPMYLGNCEEIDCEYFQWCGDSYHDRNTECYCLLNGKSVFRSETDKIHFICPLGKVWDEVDTVEVVRCKDCVNYQETMGKDSGKPCGYGSCRKPTAMIGIVFDEDFCSHGERRTNASN